MWQDYPYSQRSNATKRAVVVEAEGDGEEWEGWTKLKKEEQTIYGRRGEEVFIKQGGKEPSASYERGQEVHGTYMVFLKKSHLGQMGHFSLKMARCHNSGSTIRVFFKLNVMKGAKKYMKIALMVFQKKTLFWAYGPFWA